MGDRYNPDVSRLHGALDGCTVVYPDQRLGQIVFNAMRDSGPDLFDISNDDLIKQLQDYCVRGMEP